MPSYFSPKWAFQAQALHSATDPHLAPGVHLRLLPSPLLGLPVAPFLVYRANLGQGARAGKTQSALTWIDSRGVTLTPPFQVTPDNPVTGWLPDRDRCCWIDVDAVPERLGPIFEPIRPPLTPIPRPPIFGRSPFLTPGGIQLDRLPGPVANLGRFTTIRVDAVVDTPRGEAVLASRDRAPYHLSASRIRRIVITGQGEVRGARWLSDDVLLRQLEFWRALSLPVATAARYVALPNAVDLARDRVRRGAPRRLGLHDRPDAASPAAAPAATPADEWRRLEPLVNELTPSLERLVSETTVFPGTLTETRSLVDEQSGKVGEFDVNCLGLVMTGSLDPGMGKWLGFVEVDEQPPSTVPGDVVVYAVRGVWSIDPERFGDAEGRIRLASLGNNSIGQLPDVGLAAVAPRTFGGDLLRQIAEKIENPGTLLDLWTLVCATIDHPPSPPSAPSLGEPSDRDRLTAANRDRTAWVPQPIPDPARPPAPRREITLPLAGLVAGATLAVARRDPTGLSGLNPKSPSGRAQSLVPGIIAGAEQAGLGTVSDRTAPGTSVSYRAAQADWFGRWSPWQERAAADGTPPAPPAPVLNLTYTQPSFDPAAVPSTPLTGTLRLQVAVPTLNELPPGARPLQTLRVEYGIAPTPAALTTAPAQTFSQTVPDRFIHAGPTADRPDWIVELPAPAIPRCDQRTVAVTARWEDTNGLTSSPADPVRRTLYDPRPPEPLVLERPLQYAARPDVMGQAKVELSWTASDRQRRFRVFYANQTRLVGKLTAENTPVAAAILQELAAASDPAALAEVFRTHAAYWPRDWFDQLTQAPLERNGTPTMGYSHSVSGSLRVLSVYRIVSVGEANTESAFAAAPLLVYAVPNTGPPPQPRLQVTLARNPVTQALATPVRAQITLEVPQGLVKAREYRLHRSILDGADLLAMPVAQTGLFPALPADSTTDPPQRLVIQDSGSLVMPPDATPLQLWSTYFWRAVVRGEPEPGSAAAGQAVSAPWSPASVAVSATLIPPEPPPPVTDLAINRSGSSVTLSWRHPDPLRGGRLGSYRFDIYRQPPGERLSFFRSLLADALPADGGRQGDRTGSFSLSDSASAPGTRYRVVVVDPLERTSPQVAADTVTS